MAIVISKDNTPITFEKAGQGPVVILVAAALSDRSDTRKLAAILAEHFTVINYDRRGRGESGDTRLCATVGGASQENASGAKEETGGWALRGSNPRPSRCKRDALAN